MTKFIKLTKDSKAEEALDLPEGRLALNGFQISFTPKDVTEAAKCIIEKGNCAEMFYTQADIIEYAGNNLNYAASSGYLAF